MGEDPQKPETRQLAGGNLARAGRCTEPLESQRGFQMKAVFVLQNLKPPLPTVCDRDKRKWENLLPLTPLCQELQWEQAAHVHDSRLHLICPH